MSWRNLTDRVVKQCRNTFGETVTYIPMTGDQFEFKGIFDNETMSVDPETQTVISINQPIIGVRLADIPLTPKRGDMVRLNSVDYRIMDSQEDGWGHARLTLQKV